MIKKQSLTDIGFLSLIMMIKKKFDISTDRLTHMKCKWISLTFVICGCLFIHLCCQAEGKCCVPTMCFERGRVPPGGKYCNINTHNMVEGCFSSLLISFSFFIQQLLLKQIPTDWQLDNISLLIHWSPSRVEKVQNTLTHLKYAFAFNICVIPQLIM